MSDKKEKDEEVKFDMTYTYDQQDDEDIQYKLYKKSEFYNYKSTPRPDIKDREEVYAFHCKNCYSSGDTVKNNQILISNIINPNTPYMNMLLFHGLGSGKCVIGDTKIRIEDMKRNVIEIKIKELYEERAKKIETEKNNRYEEWRELRERYLIESYNEKNRRIEMKEIEYVYRQKISEIMRKIEIEYNGENRTITSTMRHKFMVNEKWGNKIRVEDKIKINENKEIREGIVKRIEYFLYDGYVYDLEVRENHNYVANEIISHNTCSGIKIAENFKEQVIKYGTKIYILVKGSLLKKSWINEIKKYDTEIKKMVTDISDKNTIITDHYSDLINSLKNPEQIIQSKINTYYRVMSYKSFNKRVLGEKIAKNKEADERYYGSERIYRLDNTIIIVDEAHNLTENKYSEAVKYILDKSTNLRLIMMTATPMKNYANDVIDLLNIIRPKEYQIKTSNIFTSDNVGDIDFIKGGEEYLSHMMSGYISYIRGQDPITFAKRVDKGKIYKNFIFTRLIKCKLDKYQAMTYIENTKEISSFDAVLRAISNFIIPSIDMKTNTLTFTYGNEGIVHTISSIKVNSERINNLIHKMIDENKRTKNTEYLKIKKTTISGKIFKLKYLKYFSTKFHKLIKKINKLFFGIKGARTAFIYSNLVRIGVELLEEVLLSNGYLEFNENQNYMIKNDTKCYFCGIKHKYHEEIDIDETYDMNSLFYQSPDNPDTDTDSEMEDLYEYKPKIPLENKRKITKFPKHEFKPAVFLSIKGKTTEGSDEEISEEKQKILDKYFNKDSNVNGKFIKLVLGSVVMNEGINLFNIGEIHIIDTHYNFTRTDQVVGRGIRFCSHKLLTNKENQFPTVGVYKYIISFDDKDIVTNDELLYQKGELKYILVKKIENMMKQNAIDCPLNYEQNIFKEQLIKYKDCIEIDEYMKLPPEKRDVSKLCPVECDFLKCKFTCKNFKLNREFYDENSQSYRPLDKSELDFSTFYSNFVNYEQRYIRKIVNSMYIVKSVYNIDEIISTIHNFYFINHRDLYNDLYIFSVLNDLLLVDINDFNNFKDPLYDRFKRPGYLIYSNKYYIFQPFDIPNQSSMFYRQNFIPQVIPHISLHNFIFSYDKSIVNNVEKYDFETIKFHNANKDSSKYIGIIDKYITSSNKNDTFYTDEFGDIFKIRPPIKLSKKKRGVEIYSEMGAVIAFKSKKEISKIIHDLDLKDFIKKYKKKTSKLILSSIIKNYLMIMEKYNNKNIIYTIIPSNHIKYPFPFNIHDRVKYYEKIIDNILKNFPKYKTTIENTKISPDLLNSQSNIIEQASFGDINLLLYILQKNLISIEYYSIIINKSIPSTSDTNNNDIDDKIKSELEKIYDAILDKIPHSKSFIKLFDNYISILIQ